MSQDPDNPALTQLREIRATLAGHTARFDRLERDFNELRHLVHRALVLGTTAEVGTKAPDESHGEAHHESMHHKSIDERITSIEQRVAKIEERLDC
jgi:uncharacterized protein YdcH (DUF465 family)